MKKSKGEKVRFVSNPEDMEKPKSKRIPSCKAIKRQERKLKCIKEKKGTCSKIFIKIVFVFFWNSLFQNAAIYYCKDFHILFLYLNSYTEQLDMIEMKCIELTAKPTSDEFQTPQ